MLKRVNSLDINQLSFVFIKAIVNIFSNNGDDWCAWSCENSRQSCDSLSNSITQKVTFLHRKKRENTQKPVVFYCFLLKKSCSQKKNLSQF